VASRQVRHPLTYCLEYLSFIGKYYSKRCSSTPGRNAAAVQVPAGDRQIFPELQITARSQLQTASLGLA
jgi:hypothetical protein